MKNLSIHTIDPRGINMSYWLKDHPTLLAVVLAIVAAIVIAVLLGGVNTGISVNTF